MRVPRRAHIEIRNGIHTLIFHCDGCQREMFEGMHCSECQDFDLCNACYKKNGHQHPMERFSASQNAPGQRAESNPIQKELQAASVVSPVLSQTGEPFIEQLNNTELRGTTVRQQVKITIDRQNRMQISGLLPGQELYKYKDGSLKIHWNYQVLKKAHYLNNFNCLQLSSLAGYLRSQAELQENTATKQDPERRIKAIYMEINRRYSNANEKNKNK